MVPVLLTHGFFLEEDLKEQQVMRPYPPLGLLYLAAYLQRQGVDVEVFDSTFRTRAALRQRLRQQPTGVLGLYANLLTRRTVVEIAREAQELGWLVVLGGPEPANYPGEYLTRGAGAIVVGEGEETMAELLAAWQGGSADARELPQEYLFPAIRGLIYRDPSGAVRYTPPRPQIENLDQLPWPAREQIDCREYLSAWRERHGRGSLNLITARGCPYECRWCSHSVFGRTHRRRSAGDCADELEFLVREYAPDQVWYSDDVFTISHRWLFTYAAELRRRRLRVPFETISRADRLMREEVWETLADMGCERIWIGSESGSQRILDAMHRGVRCEQVQWAVQAARRHGIQVGMFFMWGYHGETLDDIAATVDHLVQCNPSTYLTTVTYPIQGTEYFDEVAQWVEGPSDWEQGSDRDFRLRGQKPKAYYDLANRWLASALAAARATTADEAATHQTVAAEARTALQTWEVPSSVSEQPSG